MAVPEEKGSGAPRQQLHRIPPAYVSDARLQLELQKLAGEVSRQPVEEQLIEAEAERTRAEAKSLDAARFRGDVYLLVSLVMIVFALLLAILDPGTLREVSRVLAWRAP